MTKRLSFLLLDANVVIYLFKLGIWDKLVAACDLHLARTVVQESHFYEDDHGQRHDFDLTPYAEVQWPGIGGTRWMGSVLTHSRPEQSWGCRLRRPSG
jgi:hypothetical protein